jgi:integrase
MSNSETGNNGVSSRIQLRDRLSLMLRNGIWQAYLRIDGKPSRKTLETSDLEEAKSKAWQLFHEAEKRAKSGLKLSVDPTFKAVAFQWIKDELESEKPNLDTRKQARSSLLTYVIPFFKDKTVGEITELDLIDYPSYRDRETGRKLSATIINTESALIKKIFNYALKSGYIKSVPKPARRHVEANPRLGFTTEEMTKVIQTAQKRYSNSKARAMAGHLNELKGLEDKSAYNNFHSLRFSMPENISDAIAWKSKEGKGRLRILIIIQIMNGTGIRPNSLLNLTRRNVVRNKDGSYMIVNVETLKGGKLRKGVVSLNSNATSALERLLKLIPEDIDARLIDIDDTHSINNAFNKILVDCDLKKTNLGDHSLYDIRHHYISRALSKGVSVSQLAGQTLTSIQMINLHYSHLSEHTQVSVFKDI